jgi:peptidoglycan hydrolase-like protein with peptidoglycan-binding domain
MVELTLLMLREGNQNAQVGTLQILLNSRGYVDEDGNPLDVDNIFGNNTEYAVRQFQRDENLDDDGIVGFNTWSRILKTDF